MNVARVLCREVEVGLGVYEKNTCSFVDRHNCVAQLLTELLLTEASLVLEEEIEN